MPVVASRLSHAKVNLPGCPKGDQLWSRSALTSNQPGWGSRDGKKEQSLLIPPSFLKHPHKAARCSHRSRPLFFCFSSLFPSVPFPLELQSLTCGGQRILLRAHELMFTINKRAEGKPQTNYSQDGKYKTCHSIQSFVNTCVCACPEYV